MITESNGFTAVYEDGCFATPDTAVGCVPAMDNYTVQLASAPTSDVYVTASASGSPQEELPQGQTFLVYTGSSPPLSPAAFYHTVTLTDPSQAPPGSTCTAAGVCTVPNKDVVLDFNAGNWNTPQTVWLWAVPDGVVQQSRVVTINHTVISTDPGFDGATVTSVQVTLYDGDGPGLLVTAIDPTTTHPDNDTTVLVGTPTTGQSDEYELQLTSAVQAGKQVVIDVAPADTSVCLTSSDPRFHASNTFVDPTLCPLGGTTYTATFGPTDWFTPLVVTVWARNDGAVDPHTIGITQTVDATATSDSSYLTAAPGGSATQILDRLYVNIVGDGPGVFVNQSDGSTLVIMCGSAPCTTGSDSYTVRLTSQPTADVQIAIVTDGQTNVVDGGRISLVPIGGLVPTQLFSGNVTISGATVTLAAGSQLQSFLALGFAANERISIGGTGTADDTNYYVLSVAADGSSLTLTTAAPAAGTFANVAIDNLTEQGTYSGSGGHTLSYGTDSGGDLTITRNDGSSWLDSGFLEGQLIRIDSGATYKIESFSSAAGGTLNVLHLTTPGVAGGATSTVTQMAEAVTFTASNWYLPVTVTLVGDPNFILPPGRQNLRVFAKQQHVLSRIAGPLSVEGGSSNADRSLHPAVLLPGEGNGPLFAIAAQPPEWQQIDTLNVYDDGSRQNQTGTLTSTALTGFGMQSDPGGVLDFTYLLPHGTTTFPFGEPGKYPDGISYGSITLDASGNFVTDNNVATIEDLNILLGQGNDNLTIVSTLVPGPDFNPVTNLPGRAAAHGGLTTVHGGGNQLLSEGLQAPATFDVASTAVGGGLVRRDGFSWQADGFAVGDQVTVQIGGFSGSYTVIGFATGAYGSGDTILLAGGPSLTAGTGVTAVVTVSDALAVTGTFDLVTQPTFDANGNPISGNEILRNDGVSWQSAGFTYGQQVYISGIGLRNIVAFDNSSYGDGSGLIVDGAAFTTALHVSGTVSVTSRYRVSGAFSSTASSITLASGTFAASGLAPGMSVAISGVTGTRTIATVSGNKITLTGGAIPATLTGGLIAAAKIGGDTLTVTGGASTLAAGGPGTDTCTLDYTTCTPSPLVLYGDTSQDGLWYGGDPSGITLHDFGPKPMPHDAALPLKAAYVPSTPNGTITRSDGGSFITDGFAIGQLVTADVTPQQVTVSIGAGGAITRTDGVSWLAAGFAHGQLVTIDGVRVGTVATVTATTLTLGSLTADFASFVTTGTPQDHLVSVAELGTVNALTATTLTLTFLTSNFAQLVSAGASTHSLAVANRVGNGSPFFVFALGDPFEYSGNDVIDASQAFAKADPTNLPSIGITAYGGPGDDTIKGSQTGDILAGGSGNDTISGGRGQNEIYGDAGVNVDVITRLLTIPTTNSSAYANRDLLLAGQDLLYGTSAGSTANDPYQSQLAIGLATSGTTGTISRSDGGSWLAAGFAAGQTDVTTMNVSFSGTTITLAASSPLTNFHAAGYFTGQRVELRGTGGADDAVYTIASVTPTTLTFTTAAPVAGTFNGVTIDGLDLVTIDGVAVGYLTGATASTLTLMLTNAPAFAAVNAASKLHVVSVSYYGNYDSIVIGDQGSITQDVAGARDTIKPLPPLPQELQTTLRARTITSLQPDNGANDTIYGNGGDSILIGGTGDDSIDGGPGRDLIFGDHVLLDRSSAVTPYAGCATQLGCFVSPLDQDLAGTQLYSTAIANEGALLADGTPQLDPSGHASWGDFRITQVGQDPNEIDASVYTGKDYIAGGGGNDMIFGGLGDDTIQGDGSIDFIAHPYVTGNQGGDLDAYAYASACTNGAHPGSATLGQRVGACRDANDVLYVNSSVARSNDGADYIEGGGGNNVIFGNDGQNDIVGGNSDFFGTATPNLRTSGSNTIFGNAGTQLDREDVGDTSAQGHAADASVIVANNGEIIRIVGTNHTPGLGAGGVQIAETGYVRFNYDTYTDGLPLAQQEHIVVRGVTLLDFTPGGPDLAGQPGPLVTGAKATNGVGDIGGTPMPANAADGISAGTLQKGSEIHAENGDAFVYGGPADDVIFGGAQDDSIILGYGDNWVSGGRGDQCIIGGGGRCFASRVGVANGEPLYGVAPIAAGSISELITTPGNVQQAVINVSGALQYTAELYPYNWDPSTWIAPGVSNGDPTFSTDCKPNKICPVYQPRYGHNIIYGGWGSGVVHGGPGQSAISGAEAPIVGYADNFNLYGNETQAQYLSTGVADTVLTDYVLNKAPIETDYYHPFNPGNPAGYMPETNPPNGNEGRGYNIGKSLYFDAEDPRRQVDLFPSVIDPTVTSDGLTAAGYNPLLCKWTAPQTPQGAGCLPFFLTFDPTDPALPLDTTWYPGTGDPQMPTTGDKALFGDLGEDYIVAGMGRDRVYGGFGDDLIDLRASTLEDDGLNDGPVPNLVNNGNGTFSLATGNYVYGTPAWEALAYGGAGQDIYFAGTGGDRLIDWVGNHNSYYAPFSQFGMPTVSRTLQPALPEFLYALSKSDGADPLLALRYGGAASRNGEPYGELGLVLQHDDAWHEQTGPPFNEMPENLGGVGIDVKKTANIRPFNSPGISPVGTGGSGIISLPSGNGLNLPSGVNASNASALPFSVTGAAGATVTYTFTEGTHTVTGSGTLDSHGSFAGTVDVSAFPDGTITVTMTLSGGGAPTQTLTSTLAKNTLPPTAPTVSAPAYANNVNETAYAVTVTGQVGATATVVITDGQTPIAEVAGGQDVIGSSGTVTILVDVSNLVDGTITVSVTLTNAAGDSSATTLTETKYTVAPALQVTVPIVVNAATVNSFLIAVTGVGFDSLSYSITDGTTTLSGSRGGNGLPGSGKWSFSPAVGQLADGPLTLTVTEGDSFGNQTVYTATIIKAATPPPAPTVALNPLDDNGVSNSDYVTTVTSPRFNVNSAAGTTTTVYVNGTVYTGQNLADGRYTVTAKATDAYGNVSSAGTAPKTLVVDTTPPAGSFTITGKAIGGQLTTASATLSLALSFSDAGGLAQMAISTDGGATFGATTAYASTASATLPAANGIYTVVVRVTDAAGHQFSASQTVRLDTIGPTVGYTLSAPTNNGSYDLGTNPTFTDSASDLDGVASISATLDSATTISSGGTINLYTLTAGAHTILIKATDGAGNISTSTVTFQVHVTVQGLINAVNYGYSSGLISSSIRSSLLSTLQSALSAGTSTSEKSYLNQFVSQVNAAGSSKITSSFATLLDGWAQDLIGRL